MPPVPVEKMTPWDAEVAPRLAPAWFSMARELSDGCWKSGAQLRSAMLQGTDLDGSTPSMLLSIAFGQGLLERRGARMQRRYRLAPDAARQRPEFGVA